jgi:hypothetical protein
MKWTLLVVAALGFLFLTEAFQGRESSPASPVTTARAAFDTPVSEPLREGPTLAAANRSPAHHQALSTGHRRLLRRPVESGTATIQIKQVSPNDLLAAPVARVLDPLTGAQHELIPGWNVEVPAEPARVLRLTSTSPGWMLSTDTIELIDGAPPEFEVYAESSNLLIFGTQDSATLMPIEHLDFKVVWDDAVSGLRGESELHSVQAPGGQFLVESVPIDEGRFRVEASSEGYFGTVSEWIHAAPGQAQVTDLAFHALTGGSGTIAVRIVDAASGQGMAGVHVELFEELPESPISSVVVGEHDLTPIYDTDAWESPGRSFGPVHTGPDGLAEFVVPAPSQYRIALHGEEFPFRLEEALLLEVDAYVDHVIEFAEPGSLSGSLVLADSFPEDRRRSLQSAWLRGTGGLQSTALGRNGAFHFPAVMPGEYELFIDRATEMPDRSMMLTRFVTREVSVHAGQDSTVTLDMRTVTPKGLVEGRLDSPLRGASGMGLVALSRSTDGTLAGATGKAEYVTAPDLDGSFTFQDVEPGDWLAIAMEQSDDGREVGLLYGTVKVGEDGLQVDSLSLATSGSVLTIASDFQDEELEAYLDLSAGDGTSSLSRLIASLPSVKHEPGVESFAYGLPGDGLHLIYAGLQIPVGSDGTRFTPSVR